MLDRQRLLEFQTKREDNWQEWQAQMALDQRKWQKEQEDRVEERHKEQLSAMGVWVTIAVVLATVAGSVIQANDWIEPWFGIADLGWRWVVFGGLTSLLIAIGFVIMRLFGRKPA